MGKKKSKMGRPAKRPEDRLSVMVNVRLTPAEFKRLQAEAKQTGLSLSEALKRPWREEG